MSKLERIDQYVCIDVDELICEEMRLIIESDCGSTHPDDVASWESLQAAAKLILEQYDYEGLEG